ncbi:MAG: hypothetical protein DMG36_01340 [Acidobacteria bacterium]|nr:MAG: hypothetical protein DMG36_01340 [Acidobacteriota bacterium]
MAASLGAVAATGVMAAAALLAASLGAVAATGVMAAAALVAAAGASASTAAGRDALLQLLQF